MILSQVFLVWRHLNLIARRYDWHATPTSVLPSKMYRSSKLSMVELDDTLLMQQCRALRFVVTYIELISVRTCYTSLSLTLQNCIVICSGLMSACWRASAVDPLGVLPCLAEQSYHLSLLTAFVGLTELDKLIRPFGHVPIGNAIHEKYPRMCQMQPQAQISAPAPFHRIGTLAYFPHKSSCRRSIICCPTAVVLSKYNLAYACLRWDV